MQRWRTCSRYVGAVIIWLAWWAAVGAGIEWAWPRVLDPKPFHGALFGLFMGAWMLLYQFAEHKGWVRGIFVDRRKVQQRRKQLALDREQIIQDARAKVK